MSLLDRKIVISTAVIGLLFLIVGIIIPNKSASGWFTGYLIGMVTVLLHLGASMFSKKTVLRDFISSYFFGLLLRFVLVLTLFVLILILTKIDELSFTVSFIISYILHSVNEVILLNQKLSD
jgi:hypothetical protein